MGFVSTGCACVCVCDIGKAPHGAYKGDVICHAACNLRLHAAADSACETGSMRGYTAATWTRTA